MNEKLVLTEIKFKAVRSGGPGGQHANKVSSKVIGSFDVDGSNALSETEKLRLMDRLEHRLTSDGQLSLSCDTSRSQHQNKTLVGERMLTLLKGALITQQKRIPTKLSRSVKARRSERKIQHAQKKARRRKPDID